MAPRQPKPKADDASTTPSPFKPKTEKAKVEKVKADKPKVEKVKAENSKTEKAAKPKVVKADKEEKAKAEKTTKKEKAIIEKDVKGEKEKEKAKAITGDEAVELIAKYLKEQNRPYSATEVSANLHGKVTKTVADKLMKEMEQNGLIKAKATNGDKKGSQWVFWAIQNPADAASPEELAAMESSITALRESLPNLKSKLKILTTKLHTLKSAPTTSELAAMVGTLARENAEKAAKLKWLQNGSVKMVTKEEMEKVENDFKYWGNKRRARKSAYLHLEGQLLEGMSKEEIEEKVGVEPDTYLA